MSDGISDNENNTEASNDTAKGGNTTLAVQFPADLSVWFEARKLISDKNLRVDDMAICVSQDPALVIEMLKTSNAMYFSAGRQPITSTRTAIVRLGSDVVLDLLERMKDRPQITDPDVSNWFEVHRSRCKRTSLVSRILSESIAKTLSDECQAVGLFLNVGEMLAVINLGTRYVRLAEELSRSGVNYRLAQDMKFDVEKMGLNYLRRNGIPEALLFAIDRDGRSKSAEKAIMKPLCMAAGELVDAFDSNRWDKFAPGKTIPPKSAIRMLPLTDSQYLKLYERISEYLFAIKVTEEKKKQEAVKGPADFHSSISMASSDPDKSQEILQSEINTILKDSSPPPSVATKPAIKDAKSEPSPVSNPAQPSPVGNDKEDQFSLTAPGEKVKKAARKSSTKIIAPPKLASSKAVKIVTSMADMMNSASNSEELLSQILAMLVDQGPFKKSALIVVSKDRTKAIVVAARGPNIGNGQKLDINDPLSPLSQCFSKVQSFGNRESKNSPFGSKSFALAPIDADHETPVALYADCGNEGSISFEARRVFRTVVDILNEKLPQVPGGIPVELN